MAETAQAFDIAQGKMVDVLPPEEKPPVDPPADPPVDPPADPPAADPPAGDPPADPPPATPPADPPPADKPVDIIPVLKEKYGIDSEEDLQKILDYNQSVKEELEAEKKKEPVYKSDRHKKIVNWLDESGYALENLNEGLESAGTLMGLQVDKMEGRRALEEAFVLDNTDISRDKAKKLFNKEFEKYTVKEESFADKAEFEEAKELADIKREKDEAKARKFLKGEQEKLKSAPVEKKAPEEAKPIEAPVDAVQSYSAELDKVFDDGKGKKFDRFVFQDEKDPTLKVEVLIPPDKMKVIKDISRYGLKNPGLYDDKKKIPNFDALAHIEQVAFALYGRTLLEDTFKNALTLGKTVRAEQLAGLKPDKESKGKGDAGIPSIDDQFKELAKKEVQNRTKR